MRITQSPKRLRIPVHLIRNSVCCCAVGSDLLIARIRSAKNADAASNIARASRRMSATSGLAVILRDAPLRVAPQDEVGEKLALGSGAIVQAGRGKSTRRADFYFRRRANHIYDSRHPVPGEGALAIVTNVGTGCGGRGGGVRAMGWQGGLFGPVSDHRMC